MDVVSLLPSATEICYSLGVQPVGVSHECDYPPAAREIPAVNDVRIDPSASSESINEQVADTADDGGVYEIHEDVLAELDPDVIITQGICDVCAVDRVYVADVVADLGLDARVLTTDPHSLADLYDDIHRIGEAVGRGEAAATVVADLKNRVNAIEQRTSAIEIDERPRVAVFDWMDPVMLAGHWVPELVSIGGGRYDLVEAGARSTPWEWADIREYDPEVIAVAPCGFGLEQAQENITDLTERPGWDDLAAVRDERVTILDGHHYVNRPGPRLVDAAAYLAGIVHPELFGRPPSDVATDLSAATIR